MTSLATEALIGRLELAFGDALARAMREAKAGRLTTGAERRDVRRRFRRDLSDAAIELLPEAERARFVLEADKIIAAQWPKLLRLSRLAPRRTPMQEFSERARRQIASATHRHGARAHAPEASTNGHARTRERADGPSRRRERASPDKEGEKPPDRQRGRGRGGCSA